MTRGTRPDGPDWIELDVYLRDTKTGEQRTYQTWGNLDTVDFAWSDGNDACDCNRSINFARAGGETPKVMDPEAHPCGDSRFTVDQITYGDSVVYRDSHDPHK